MVECSRVKKSQVEPWWSVIELSRRLHVYNQVEPTRGMVECSSQVE